MTQLRSSLYSLGFRILCGAALLPALTTSSRAAEWLLAGNLGAHDPSIIREDGAYENGNWWWSPATGPGLAMKFSTDGITWNQGLQFFTADNRPAWWTECAPAMTPLNVWAPDIIKFRGRYWCFYSISEFGTNNSAIGLASATGIFKGDWRHDGLVLASHQGTDPFNAVDPSITIDEAGNPWMTFGSWFDGLHVVPLDPETMMPAAGPSYPTIARRTGSEGVDNPTIIYNNGYYYLFSSVDVCCNGKNSTQKVAYGRSRTITGPYEGKPGDAENSVSKMITGTLTVLERGDGRWAGVGAASLYRYRDGWIIIRHGYDKNAGGAQKMRISDLYWDEAGWPTLVPPALPDQTVVAGIRVTLKAPSSISHQWQVSTNGGTTWTNLPHDATYTGATAATLTFEVTAPMNGHRYRVVTGNGSTPSNALTLTVTPHS